MSTPAEAKRVAALYDIHANPHALGAVLEEIEDLDVDLVVFGGDLAWGPLPRPTVETVIAMADRSLYVRGNGDREMATRVESDGGDDFVAAVSRWCADQLSETQRSFLGRMAATVGVDIDGLGPTLFCHGAPRSDEEIITPATSEGRLSAIMRTVEEPLVVCGHTHVQFDRAVGKTRVVNAGSIGMPYEDGPGAYWALLGPDVSLRRTDYDYAAAAASFRAGGCPHADEFAADVLQPPSRQTAIDHFEAAAARADAG